MADAALGLFAERGYGPVTVDEIAARAGVTKGAFYYYYADKADVATDLWRELWQRLAHEAQQAMDPEAGPVENLRSCLRAMLDDLGDLGEARFFLREAWMLPEIEVAGRRDQEASIPLIEAVLWEAAGPSSAPGNAGSPPRSPTTAPVPSLSPRRSATERSSSASRSTKGTDVESPTAAHAPTAAQALVEAAARVLVGAFAEAVLYILTTGQAEASLRVLDQVVEAVVAAVQTG